MWNLKVHIWGFNFKFGLPERRKSGGNGVLIVGEAHRLDSKLITRI